MEKSSHGRFNQLYQRWMDWRLPARDRIVLRNRRLFIFPTRAGFVFFGLLILLWLVATNFENNLIFGLTFLLAAIFVVAIFHTFFNLSGLSIEAGYTPPCFCGSLAEFGFVLSQRGRRYRDNIRLVYQGESNISLALPGVERVEVSLAIPAPARGWFKPGRVTLETRYPLGLLRAWTILDLNLQALVYPRPIKASVWPQGSRAGEDGNMELVDGREDFRSLEKYRPGEALGRIAWKHYAREQGLHTKHYADPVDEYLWLDWEAFPGLDTEMRLSRLCGWCLELTGGQALYGLRLPGIEIAPARGEAHKNRVLKELALFGLSKEGGD